MSRSSLPLWSRLAVLAVLLVALVLAVAPSAFATPTQPPMPPSVAVEDTRPVAGRLLAASPDNSVPNRIAATLTVDGACVDADLDKVCDGVSDTYKTIQKAIDIATAGDTINVLAGVYTENVLVNKTLTLAGAGAASTTVYPATSNPNPCTGSSLCGGATGASHIFVVQADNVVISGFTLDGDNTSLTSGIVREGADLDARTGVIVNSAVGVFTGLEVHHMIVKNVYLRGIQASSGGTFNFHDNTVTNVQGDSSSIAMFAWYGPGTMANNTVSYANDAISANHSKGIQFLNNTITHSGSGIHTDNSIDGGGTSDLIQDNLISDCATDGYGIFVFVPYVAPTVNRNSVSGCAVGMSVFGQGAAVTTNFTNNVVTGVAGSVGAFISTDMVGWGYSDVSVNFTGNVITGHANGIWFSANPLWSSPYVAKTISAVFSNNSVTANTYPAGVDTQGTYNIDLSGNWWGDADPADVKAAVNGGVLADYTPWLASGTDTNGVAAGFRGDFSALWVDDDSPQSGTVGRIQEGINLVASGGTVNVVAGTYVESPNLSKPVKLLGAGSANTVINGTLTVNGSASGVAGTPTLIKGFDIYSATAIDLGHTLQYARIEDCKLGGSANAIRVGSQANVAHLEFVGLTFYSNDIDVYFSNEALVGASTADDILFDGCAFTGLGKGIYAEKLSNAVIKNSTFTDSGNHVPDISKPYYGQAIDINLKWADYTNITIQGNTFTNSGNTAGSGNVGGSAIGIKARGTGTDNSYLARPATLTNVTVTGNTFTGGQRGIRLGEPGKGNTGPTNVTIDHNKFINIPTTPTGTDAAGAVVNTTTVLANAESNWWGSVSGPGPVAPGTGAPVTANIDYQPWCNEDFTTCTYQVATLAPTTGDALFCGSENATVTIGLANITDLYGYQFKISYNPALVTATGAFDYSFFDTDGDGSEWGHTCAAGVCSFSKSELRPDPAVTGSGPLATVTLHGVAAGTFTMQITADIFGTRDGVPLSHTVAELPLTVCGLANVSGKISLQGRATPIDAGTVTLTEQTPASFGPHTQTVTFSATDGSYTITGVPYLPGGSSYKIIAEHGLYLDNADVFNLTGNVANKNTRLWGGDANNSGGISIDDLACIGGAFGSGSPATCSGAGSSDINKDNATNILDLTLAGGNYGKTGEQGW